MGFGLRLGDGECVLFWLCALPPAPLPAHTTRTSTVSRERWEERSTQHTHSVLSYIPVLLLPAACLVCVCVVLTTVTALLLSPAAAASCCPPSPHQQDEIVSNHDELMCNFFAQADALAYGKSRNELRAQNVPDYLIPHRSFTGGWVCGGGGGWLWVAALGRGRMGDLPCYGLP